MLPYSSCHLNTKPCAKSVKSWRQTQCLTSVTLHSAESEPVFSNTTLHRTDTEKIYYTKEFSRPHVKSPQVEFNRRLLNTDYMCVDFKEPYLKRTSEAPPRMVAEFRHEDRCYDSHHTLSDDPLKGTMLRLAQFLFLTFTTYLGEIIGQVKELVLSFYSADSKDQLK